MKHLKLFENLNNEYCVIITRDEMGYYYTNIFESEKDAIDYFIQYALAFLRDLYENYDDNEIDQMFEQLIEIDGGLDDLIDVFNELISDTTDEKYYFSRGELIKPEISREKFIEEYKLKKDTKKYNL